MNDYISREKVLKLVAESGKFSLMAMIADPEIIPSADVRENIHGEWEEVTDYKNDNIHQWHIICSVCHCRGQFESDNFCPNCGADMRGKADE